MKLEDYTKKQQECIKSRGKSLIVSAAAGSGKTAVLVERIYQLLLEGASIDKMLIVTFTDFAASEMKEKIKKKLKEEAINSTDPKQKKNLRAQYDFVDDASISTFHSFYLDVIKNFFYIENIEPNLKIADDTQMEMLYLDSFDELVSNYYDNSDANFLDYIYNYCKEKDINGFRDTVIGIYKKILSYKDGIKFLDFARSNIVDFIKNGYGSSLLNNLDFSDELNEIKVLLQRATAIDLDPSVPDEYKEKGTSVSIKLLNKLEDAITNQKYEEFNNIEIPYKWEVGPRSNNSAYIAIVSDELNNIKDRIKKLIEDFKSIFNAPLHVQQEELSLSLKYFDFLVDAIRKFDDILSKKKKKKGIMSFDDSERYVYNLLTNDEVSNFYKRHFDYVFIDEYQDTSDIQNEIINKISKDNNAFFVGDVKQSIYSFRNADPSLFIDRKVEFSDRKGSHELKELNENFRSKEEIVKFVNKIFEWCMPNEYKEGDKLVARTKNFDTSFSHAEHWNVEKGNIINDEEIDDSDIEDLENGEVEAYYTLKAIIDYYGKEYFDDEGNIKFIDYKDIVILLRTKSYANIIYKVLNENDIPCYVTDDEGYYDTIEIGSIISILKVIDNYMQDVELITALKSHIFNFTTDELADIRIDNKNIPYYEAFTNYDGNDRDLNKKIRLALEKINKYRLLSNLIPLEDLIWEIMTNEGFYLSIGALNDGDKRQANLRLLVDKARNYRLNFSNSLSGFLKYIDLNKDGKFEEGQSKNKSSNANVVRIMTIHKSKGLEFPMVIIPDTGSGNPRELSIDRRIGIGLPYQNRKELYKNNTIIQNIINFNEKKRLYAEELHILYVGLTRAKDYLITISTDKVKNSILPYKNICNVIGIDYIEKPELNVSDINMVSFKKELSSRNLLSYIDKIPSDKSEKLKDKFEFLYDDTASLNVHSKYSVSQINELNREEKGEVVNYHQKVHRDEEFTPIEIGNITHKVLEKIDLKEAKIGQKEYLQNFVDELIRDEILLPNEKNALDFDKLLDFINLDIFDRMINANEVYREKAFIMEYEIDGVKTLVQGIIDCFFIEDDGAILIDYKTTKHTDDDKIRNDYEKQIEIYKKAIEDGKNVKVKEAYLFLTNQGRLLKM